MPDESENSPHDLCRLTVCNGLTPFFVSHFIPPSQTEKPEDN